MLNPDTVTLRRGVERLVRFADQHPDARIIVVTQHDSPAMRERAFDCGASEFLPKTDLTLLPALVTSN